MRIETVALFAFVASLRPGGLIEIPLFTYLLCAGRWHAPPICISHWKWDQQLEQCDKETRQMFAVARRWAWVLVFRHHMVRDLREPAVMILMADRISFN